MGMHKNLQDVVELLRSDEQLLRLLHYPPSNLAKDILDPLDNKLKNIRDMEMEKLWEIRDEHIHFASHADDLEKKHICRIYLYAGRRRPTSNYIMADQEIVIDILCHSDFENGDLRSMRIADRVNKILSLSRVTGMGKVDYVLGSRINAPKDYVGYQHIFKIGSIKK